MCKLNLIDSSIYCFIVKLENLEAEWEDFLCFFPLMKNNCDIVGKLAFDRILKARVTVWRLKLMLQEDSVLLKKILKK